MKLVDHVTDTIEFKRPIVARAVCALIAMSLAGSANSQVQFRTSPLCEAIVAGDVGRAMQLTEQGADVNASLGCALVAGRAEAS